MTFCGDVQGDALALGDDAPGPLSTGPVTDHQHAGRAASAAYVLDGSAIGVAGLDLARVDDVALMARVGQGCQASFAVLVERHAAALYRVAARMLGDGHEAEDVVQDCFARMWQNAPRWYPTGAGLIGWLHRVAMNLCFDRKRRFRVVVTDDLPDCADQAPLADRMIEQRQACAQVAAALADLPERYRAALVLCYYENFSNALAAQVLDLNIKAMESLLFRARRQMRELLEARDVTCRDVAFVGAAAVADASANPGAGAHA
ncbi:RNA polymerase sigma factor [Novosphingobium sp. SG720]|uniref:RNA polymerase sigma factor n=1 Tax=Novosphingobium TaxID=165696 RepID=UPI001447ADA4|nr:RNA polymerase sigma factor [Novosphingobium sp. SG720]NKJ42794.1 RNA polymerase sigma-70 factor (ECF subfamily) [Novosphingobium sp. SG720]